MICLHDDTPLGKDEPAGLGGRNSMPYADELAKRGYVCLVPDYPSYGENPFDFKKHAGTYASGAMKAVWDNIRGIDLLETLPEVNCKRIGIIGHGLGGQNALLTAVFDWRLSAVVSSCGFTTWSGCRGGNLAGWSDERMMPRIKSALGNDPAKIPFDFPDLLATLAPRAVLVSAPLGDEVMDVEGVKTAAAAASAIYRLRRATEALKIVHPAGGRDFTAAARNEAFAWLDQRFRR
jgi:dienelactone hydrolase